MKIGEHVIQGLKDALQKKIGPWPAFRWWNRIFEEKISSATCVFNIQGEAKKIKIEPECLILIYMSII